MGFLDSLFSSSLPKLSGSSSIPDNTISYALAPVSNVLNESYAKVTSTFGDITKGAIGSFKSLTSGGPGFAKLATPTATEPSATARGMREEGIGDTTGSGTTNHKVKLTARVADGASQTIVNDPAFKHEPLMQHQVEFDTMPEVNEVRTVEYEALAPPQLPGEFQKYKGTKSTQYTITAVFTCRTKTEARRNYVYLNNLRSWTMPYFGEKQRAQFSDGSDSGKLGAPPAVLDFSGWRGIVGTVPVVITSLNWNWPKDCDWIPTGIPDAENGEDIPFPTVMNVNITIVESFSAEQFNGFDLVQFRNGRMVNAFKPLSRGEAAPTVAEPIGGQQGITNGVPDTSVPNLSEAAQKIRTTGDFARFDRQVDSVRAELEETNRLITTADIGDFNG